MSIENENSEFVNVYDELHMLVTSPNQHKRITESHQSGVSESSPSIKQCRKSSNCYLKCKEHASSESDKNWTITNDQCNQYIKFQSTTQLPNGRLPLLKQVLCFTLEADLNKSVMDLMLHWINCNVYAQSQKTVTEKLKKYKQELSDPCCYPKAKQSDTYWSRVTKFVNDCQKLFNIKGSSEQM